MGIKYPTFQSEIPDKITFYAFCGKKLISQKDGDAAANLEIPKQRLAAGRQIIKKATIFPFNKIDIRLFIILVFFLIVILSLLTYRYWFLGDDCYISFRYAKHFVEGLGLTFNPGIRVEGYTNFLWVLIVAGGMKLGITPEILSNVLGIISGFVLIGLLITLGKATYKTTPVIFLAPICLALSRTFTCWMTGGLETRFFTLLVFTANFFLLKALEILPSRNSSKFGLFSGILFGLASLARPEGYLFFGSAMIFLMIYRSFKLRPSDSFIPFLFLLLTGPHLVWRYLYYGDILPNTFYAKVPGLWVKQGFVYLFSFFKEYSLWIILIPMIGIIGYLFVAHEKSRKWKDHRFLISVYCFSICALYTLYILCIGGDFFEFRLLDPIIPFIYFCFQMGVIGIFELNERYNFLMKFKNGVNIVVLIIIFISPILTAIPLIRGFKGIGRVNNVESIREYAKLRAWEGKVLSEFILPGDKVAAKGAGALPYFNSDNFVLDIHGMNDKNVAKQKIDNRGVIGHEKMASREYISRHKITFLNYSRRRIFATQAPPKKIIDDLKRNGFYGIKIKDDLYLICETTLTNEEIERRFAEFEIVFLPTKHWCDLYYQDN